MDEIEDPSLAADRGFDKNRRAAKTGGKRAGDARKAYEKNNNNKVVSNQNFLQQIQASKEKKQMDETSE